MSFVGLKLMNKLKWYVLNNYILICTDRRSFLDDRRNDMAAHPQLRLVRLVMLLVIGALTIVLYASYYTSPMLPTRIVTSSASDYDTNEMSAVAERHIMETSNAELLRFADAASDTLQPQQLNDELQSSVIQTDPG